MAMSTSITTRRYERTQPKFAADGVQAHPSDFADTLSASARMWLRTSHRRGCYVPANGRWHDAYTAKAIFSKQPALSPSAYSALQIAAFSTDDRMLLLDERTGQDIARRFQPQMLSYRLQNASKVCNSAFDVPGLTMPMRELARILGACVPDDAKLQSELVELLRERDEEARFDSAHDLRVTVIEAVLFFFHEGRKSSVYVQEITDAANTILRNRGETLQLTARAVGDILRSINFQTIRLGSTGRGIRLLKDSGFTIHKLAANLHVPTIAHAAKSCVLCKEWVEKQNRVRETVQ